MKINGQSVDLGELVNDAISQAETFALGRVDLERIAAEPTTERQATMRRLLVVRRIVRDNTGWEPDYRQMRDGEILESVQEQATQHNKRAGLRGLKTRYGHNAAERIVQKHTGRHISLR